MGQTLTPKEQLDILLGLLPPYIRLSVSSTEPNPSTSLAAQSSIYAHRFGGGQTLPMWDGTIFRPVVITAGLTTTLASMTAAKLYDMFVWMDGTTMRLVRGQPWTSATARDASYLLSTVNGIDVNVTQQTVYVGSTTYTMPAGYGTYVGTILASAATTIEWTAIEKGLWNKYNRVRESLKICPGYVNDAVNTAIYTASTTLIEMNGANNGRVKFVLGEPACILANASGLGKGGDGDYYVLGIGIDAVTAKVQSWSIVGGNLSPTACSDNNDGVPLPIGSHYVSILIGTYTAVTATIYADFGNYRKGVAADPAVTYLIVSLEM